MLASSLDGLEVLILCMQSLSIYDPDDHIID